ncbi:phosphotransferase [Nocardiopsis sp. NPDC007018]|uniref:phosphotransferase n=1 Tax=Nocardiopsis sp. NPDC007018 TaxID=3155721 RepID=UPI00340B450A
MTTPVPLASGRDAEVFALDGARVLRRYRHARDTTAEAAAMARAADDGYPVPRVYRADHGELEMERLHGPTMLDAASEGRLTPEETGRELARLHGRLHAVPKGSGGRLLHLDLHPGNVILTRRGPMVVDWTNAREGVPGLDLAVTALLLALTGLCGPPGLAPLAEACLAPYVRHTGGRPGRFVDAAVALRADDPHLTAEEVARLPRAAALVRAVPVRA